MKKTLTLSFRSLAPLAGLVAISAQAQFLTLTDDWGSVVNGQTIERWVDASAMPDPVVYVHCVVAGSSPVVVQVRRYEVEIPEELTMNYFCWGECYAPDTSGDHPYWQGMENQTLFPAEPYDGFHAYYRALGVQGPATFRYVWFNTMNENDSVFVDIVFHGSAVGIEESASAVSKFEAYPVPSGGRPVELKFDAPRSGQQVEVEFHDALGRSLRRDRVRAGQQRLILEDGQLQPGLVFATLRVNGVARATRRLVINGH